MLVKKTHFATKSFVYSLTLFSLLPETSEQNRSSNTYLIIVVYLHILRIYR